jgi:cell division protein FtsL
MSGQRYYQTRGNNAVSLHEVYEEEVIKSRQPIKKIKQQPIAAVQPKPKRKGLVSTLFILISMFAIFSFVISRYAIICSAGNDISDIKTQMSEMQKKADELKVEITEKMDMGTVQEIAKDKLKMDFPTSEQIVYLDIDEKGQKTVSEDDKAENQVSKGEDKNINVLSEIIHVLE